MDRWIHNSTNIRNYVKNQLFLNNINFLDNFRNLHFFLITFFLFKYILNLNKIPDLENRHLLPLHRLTWYTDLEQLKLLNMMPTCLHRLSTPRAWSLSGAPWIWFWCCSCWLPWPSLSSEAWCEQQHQKCWEMRLQWHSNRLTWRCSCPPCAGSYGLSTGGLLHLPSALWALPEGPRRLPPCHGDCCVSLLARSILLLLTDPFSNELRA